MNNIEIKLTRARTVVSLLALALLAVGCAGKQEETAGFATPEAAVAALVAALEKDDTAALARLLGPGTEDLLSSGDPVADKADRADFLASYKAKNSLAADGDTMLLTVGDNEWPMPIPLVQRDGKWVWDGAAGADEVIYRRVGENELGAIDVMYGYVNAQNAYASEGRDGDPAGITRSSCTAMRACTTACTGQRLKVSHRARQVRSSREQRPKGMPQQAREVRRTTAIATALWRERMQSVALANTSGTAC